jgi:hypothetical protein
MSGLADIIDRQLRLALLRLLEEAPGYSANTAVLTQGAQLLGFHVSRDKVATTADWLQEQGLVKVETLGPVTVVTVTARGIDVAKGYAVVTGVDRPTSRA